MLQQCLHYDCNNRNNAGFCNTTMCINPRYSKIGSAQYGQGVQKQIVSNADRIRNMTDEELAEFIGRCVDHEFHLECVCFLNQFGYCQYPTRGCDENALEWLKQEVSK